VPPERAEDIAIYLWVVRALARLALTFGVIVGTLILVGGEERFGGRSFADALMYPGAPWSWGIVALSAGVVGMLGSLVRWRHLVWWGLMVLATWSTFFAISFFTSAVDDPSAATTGIAVYGYVAISSIVLALAHRRSRHVAVSE
jgi:hypothetical protein